MKTKCFQGAKRRIALAAICICVVLSFLTFLFIRSVKTQLWEKSVSTITESTRQGLNTLKIQLSEDYESMETAVGYIEKFTLEQEEKIDELLDGYTQIEKGIALYLPDKVSMPTGSGLDENAYEALRGEDKPRGIVNPHISSVTGMNVFDLYIRTVLADGTEGWLIKEYEVESIRDSFSLSFYHDTGFSYVMNTKGDILIRSAHPNSNKTIKNLFDMLPEEQNSLHSLKAFADSLEDSLSGWAVFNYHGEDTVFCYEPLKLGTDWYLISIIPKSVVSEQTNQILKNSMLLIISVIVGILILVLFYFRYANRTNKKLRNQAAYIGHLYNAIPDGVALVTVEPPYRIIQLNQEGQRLLRYPQNTADAMTDTLLQDVIYPEDYERMVTLLEDTAKNNQKNMFEHRTVKSDGSIFWASGIIEKMLDENGMPVFIAAFHDITDKKLAEEAVKREQLQERLTLVGAVSNAYPVIISVNLSSDAIRFIYIEPDIVDGLGGQTTYSEVFEDFASAVALEFQQEFRHRFGPENLKDSLGVKKKDMYLEVKQKLSDGAYHWISTQIIYVDNPYSEDRLAILMSRCIDEQRHEEEQHRQALQTALDNAMMASEAKGQFLSNMSHDIRTPMNAIVGMTAIAAAHIDDRERVRECLGKIKLSSSHLLNLINDVLDMSRIESGKFSLRDEPFLLKKLVTDSVDLVRNQAEEKLLELDVCFRELKNEEVIGDSLRVQQICINILSNAVKYTPDGGRIYVEVRQEPSARKGYQSYVFLCKDTGIGMGAEFLKKLFQPFERDKDTTNSKISGTGLGMAITKNIVDMMNGDIQVESKLGEGTVFTVTIPFKVSDVSRKEEPQKIEEPSGKPDYTGKKLLLAEDNLLNREIASELIRELGIELEEAVDGEDAVNKVAESEEGYYNLILMDIQMPKMNGYEATKAIRGLKRMDVRNMPIIAMTANAFEEDVRAALRAGMDAHFAKPIDMAALEKLLDKYLAGSV